MMSRIHIIGGPGSGKTTLARQLTATLHIPHFDLDARGRADDPQASIYAEDAIPTAGQTDWIIKDALFIAELPGWITEGIYLVSTEPFLYHADAIIYLKISWPIAVWRVIYRHIVKSLQGTNAYPGIKNLKLLLVGMQHYYLNQVPSNTSRIASMRTCIEEHKALAGPPTIEFMLAYCEKYFGLIQPPTEDFVLAYLEKYKEKLIIVRNKAELKRLLQRLYA